MNFTWTIDKVDDRANSNVGVVITLKAGGIVAQETVPAGAARSLAVALLRLANEVDPPESTELGEEQQPGAEGGEAQADDGHGEDQAPAG